MITVYFETKQHSEIIATFMNEELYMRCLPSLENWARAKGGFITESMQGEADLKKPIINAEQTENKKLWLVETESICDEGYFLFNSIWTTKEKA